MRDFLKTKRPHILMITNHGVHDWQVRSGLQDTGGQNHYVNALSETLVDLGFRVTTFNRGGFLDPITKKQREGVSYKNAWNRIVYLQGGGDRFIRKEDLTKEILTEEANFAKTWMKKEALPVDLILSHYWDGALLGILLGLPAKHVWIPHSLGALKRENFKNKPKEVIVPLNFETRIAFEKQILEKVDAVGSTSGDISKTLKTFYNNEPKLFLPPCIQTDQIHPMDPKNCDAIYNFLKVSDPQTGGVINGPTLLEISRTDQTKRKDIVIEAFAKVREKHPGLKLLLTLSPDNKELYAKLMALIEKLKIRDHVICLGTIPREFLSELYALCTVYCSPSEMEGFGMSVQEACACQRPTVSSDLVPFAVEYLLEKVQKENSIQWGQAGVVVKAGDTEGFVKAIDRLLSEKSFADNIAAEAYRITIPKFTWPQVTKTMLEKLEIRLP